MFFNARYLWGNVEDDVKYNRACDAKGIRVDVSKAPEWFISELERPLIECGAIPKDIVSTIRKIQKNLSILLPAMYIMMVPVV